MSQKSYQQVEDEVLEVAVAARRLELGLGPRLGQNFGRNFIFVIGLGQKLRESFGRFAGNLDLGQDLHGGDGRVKLSRTSGCSGRRGQSEDISG